MKSWIARLTTLCIVFALGTAPTYAAGKKKDSAADALIAEFKSLDKNSDGKLTKDEFVAGTKDKGKGKKAMTPEQQFKALDKDNDGVLSPTEFAAKGGSK